MSAASLRRCAGAVCSIVVALLACGGSGSDDDAADPEGDVAALKAYLEQLGLR